MSVKASKGQALRALVKERLAAAAEDIFVLFERTIAEYEEELCRSKEETQRKQREQQLYPKIELVQGNVQIPTWSPEPAVNQEITAIHQIKTEPVEQEEPSPVKQEVEMLPVPVPESSIVCLQIEESTEETPVEDMNSEPLFALETEVQLDSFDSDNDEDWEPPFGSPGPTRDRPSKPAPPKPKPGPETTPGSETPVPETPGADSEVSGSSLYCLEQDRVVSVDLTDIANSRDKAAEHQCPCCQKIFANKRNLLRHVSVHTGEKPHSCSVCQRSFTQRSTLDSHKRLHTGEKSYSCPICEKSFNRKHVLETHVKTHSEALFRCSVCHKAFSQQSGLNGHMNIHRLPKEEAIDLILNNPDYRQ